MGVAEWKARTEERRASGTLPGAVGTTTTAPGGSGKRYALDTLPCSLRGDPTGEEIPCPSCGGKNVLVKVFACPVHTACVVSRVLPGLKCCRLCDERPKS